MSVKPLDRVSASAVRPGQVIYVGSAPDFLQRKGEMVCPERPSDLRSMKRRREALRATVTHTRRVQRSNFRGQKWTDIIVTTDLGYMDLGPQVMLALVSTLDTSKDV